MKRILVTYGTKTGCTKGVAERVAASLEKAGATVQIVPVTLAPAAAGFDAVVVGSGVRAGQWHEAARSWVSANADALKAAPLALFTVCLTMAQDPEKAADVRAYTDRVTEDAGLTPVDVGTFAGWNEPKEFPFVERMILKAMKAPTGDFRDWAAIDAWSEKIAPQLLG
jgi:menaquinone-dependent protoporphyrinogen oxidase